MAVSLTACGGTSEAPATSPPQASSSAESNTPAPASSAPAAESSTPAAAGPVASIADAVTRTGCTGYAVADQAAPFTSEYGTCTWKGGRLQLYAFASEADRSSFFDAVKAYGVTPAQTAVAGLVVAAPDSQKNLAELRTLLGAS